MSGRVDMVRVYEMLEEGHTLADIARDQGVSRSMISAKVKNAGWRNVRALVEQEPWKYAPEGYVHDPAVVVMEHRLDILRQLSQINNHTWTLLQDEMDKFGRQDDNGKPMEVNKHLALSCIAEIRKQLHEHMDMEKVYFDADAVRRFMEIVLRTLNRVDPGMKDAVVSAFKQHRILSKFDAPDDRPGD